MSSPLADQNKFALELVDTGEIIRIIDAKRLIIGRLNPGEEEPFQAAFLDLTAYAAYPAGVSRQHAAIEFQHDQYFLTDLDSTNGTRLNGKILPPRIPFIIEEDDIITLGKIKMRLIKKT